MLFPAPKDFWRWLRGEGADDSRFDRIGAAVVFAEEMKAIRDTVRDGVKGLYPNACGKQGGSQNREAGGRGALGALLQRAVGLVAVDDTIRALPVLKRLTAERSAVAEMPSVSAAASVAGGSAGSHSSVGCLCLGRNYRALRALRAELSCLVQGQLCGSGRRLCGLAVLP